MFKYFLSLITTISTYFIASLAYKGAMLKLSKFATHNYYRNTITKKFFSTIGDDKYITIPLDTLIYDVQQVEPIRKENNSSWNNKYVGLRHGESQANILGIISSNPIIGTAIHGLTENGKSQSKASAKDLCLFLDSLESNQIDKENIIFLVSDFTRAKETAIHCIDELVVMNPKISYNLIIRKELRERFFGDFDGKELLFYNRVWPIDSVDANNNRDGVESVNEVIKRISLLINEIEKEYSNKIIVLVSHADTLQITQTFLCSSSKQCDSRLFHQYRFKNGEVRDMDILPVPVSIVYK